MENNTPETPEDNVAPPAASTYALVIAACISPYVLHMLLAAVSGVFESYSAGLKVDILAAIVAVAWIGYWIFVNLYSAPYHAAISKAFSSMKQGQ